mmetsp:Transcript_11796/g.38812  ORF Transcript_11796/g.38812 Transcript_11796/m.38812 type:complete len:197 (-) Transcript_11796:113-703(-)
MALRVVVMRRLEVFSRRRVVRFVASPPVPPSSHLQSGVEALKALEAASLSRRQAEAVVVAMAKILDDVALRQQDVVATKAYVQAVNAELNERIFNSQIKGDVAQRHLRELMEKDLRNLRGDLRTEERKDYADLLAQIQNIEKAVLKKASDDDRRIESMMTEQAHLETRILRYIFGGVLASLGGLATIALAAARLFM